MGRVERGLAAEKLKGVPKAYVLGDIHLYECPASWITRETHEIIRMVYLSMETGVLFTSGGWTDQPAWYVEAVELYRAESARVKESAQRAESREQRVKGKR